MTGPVTTSDRQNDDDDEEIQKSKQIELANACYFKGRKSWAKGNKEEALGFFRKAVAMQETALGTFHKHTARSYYFLGYALSKHSRDDEKALVAYRRTLRIRLALNGDDDITTDDVLRAIRELLRRKGLDEEEIKEYFSDVAKSVQFENDGTIFAAEGNFEQAIDAYEQCLSIEEKAAGKFPLDIGHLYFRIGQVHRQQREIEMALVAYRNALEVYESALGRDHSDSLFCLEGIEYCAYEKNVEEAAVKKYLHSVFVSIHHCQRANKYLESNDFGSAVTEYEKALDIEEAALGKYPVTAAIIRKKLGLAFRALGRSDRVILELRTVLSINIFEYGSDHQSVIAALKDLGSAMKEQGIEPTAVNKYMNTVSFSVKHERYGEHLLSTEKDYSGAIEEFQKSLALEVSALGKYHLTEGALFKQIGCSFLEQGKFDFAIVNFRNALLIYQPILGRHHGCTTSTLILIGDAARGMGLTGDNVDTYRGNVAESIDLEKDGERLCREGASEEAISSYIAAIAKEETSLGEAHLSTADLYGKIAHTLKSMSHYQRALVRYRDVLAIYRRSLDPDHPNIEKAHERLVEIAVLNGLQEDAATSYGQKVIVSIEHEARGDAHLTKQQYQDAIDEYRKALEIEGAALGDSHLVTSVFVGKLADTLRLSNRSDLAMHEYRKAMRIYVTHGCPSHDSSKLLVSVGKGIEDLGFNEAKGVSYQKIFRESVLCEDRADHARSTGNHSKAIEQYRRCVSLEESVLGKLHLSTCSMYRKIASICMNRGDYESAIVFYSKVLAINESNYGKDADITVESYNDLVNASQKQVEAAGSKIDGWTTMQYVLMGLIGLLIMIASLTVTLSNKKKFVKRLNLSDYNSIDECDGRGESKESTETASRDIPSRRTDDVGRHGKSKESTEKSSSDNPSPISLPASEVQQIEDTSRALLGAESNGPDESIELLSAERDQPVAGDSEYKIHDVGFSKKSEELWRAGVLSEKLPASSLRSPDIPVRQHSRDDLPATRGGEKISDVHLANQNPSRALLSARDHPKEVANETKRDFESNEDSVSTVRFPQGKIALHKDSWEKKVPSPPSFSAPKKGAVQPPSTPADEITEQQKEGETDSNPETPSSSVPSTSSTQAIPEGILSDSLMIDGNDSDAKANSIKDNFFRQEDATRQSKTINFQELPSEKIGNAKQEPSQESNVAQKQREFPSRNLESLPIPTNAKEHIDNHEGRDFQKEAVGQVPGLSEKVAAYKKNTNKYIVESHDKGNHPKQAAVESESPSRLDNGLTTSGPHHKVNSLNDAATSSQPSHQVKQTSALVDDFNSPIPVSSRLRNLCKPKSSPSKSVPSTKPGSKGSLSSASISLSSVDYSVDVESAENDEGWSSGSPSLSADSVESSDDDSASSASSGQMNLASRLVAFRRNSAQAKSTPSYTLGTIGALSSHSEKQEVETASSGLHASVSPTNDTTTTIIGSTPALANSDGRSKIRNNNVASSTSDDDGENVADDAAGLSVAERMKAFGTAPKPAQNQRKFNSATFK